MDRVRTAVIGTGGIFYGWGGGSGHLPGFGWVAEAQLAALCDPNENALNKALAEARKFLNEKAKEAEDANDNERAQSLRDDAADLKGYTSLAPLLDEAQPDLVVIISPASTHAPTSIAAMRAGANVICEKPMTRTWLEAQQVVDVAAETGKFFHYGENLIYGDPWQVMRTCLDAGMIGETLMLYLPLAIGGMGNFSYARDKVGALLDMASHSITLSWYLIGFDKRPTRVKAVGPHGIAIRMPERQVAGVIAELTVDDDAHLLVEYEDPKTGAWLNTHLEGSWSFRDSPETRVLGSTGALVPDGGGCKIIDSFGGERGCAPFHPSFHNMPQPPGWGGHPQQLKNMCHCILNDIKPQCDENVGADSMAIMGAAYLSQSRGRVAVSLDEFKAYARDLEAKHGENASEVMIEEALKGLARS